MDGSTPKDGNSHSILNWLAGDYVLFARKLATLQQKNHSDLDYLMEFVRRHADFANAVDKQKNSILHYAVIADREDIVKELLKLGAATDLMNDDGQTALQLAIAGGKLGMTQLLLDMGKAVLLETCLHTPAERGDLPMVSLLIDKYGGDSLLEALDQDRWRPLDLAANKGHIAVVEKLVAAGAIVDEAAIHFARLGGADEVVDYLKNKKELREARPSSYTQDSPKFRP